MPRAHKPRSGSLAFRPRKRSRDLSPRVGSWPTSTDIPGVGAGKVLGFPAYKVGMTMIGIVDDSASPSKGMEVALPVTVLETPKLTIFGIRAYKKTPISIVCIGDVISSHQKVLGKLGMKKETKHKPIEWLEKSIDEIYKISVLAFTNPDIAGTPRKKGEVVEIMLGGNVKEQIDYAKTIIGKEISVRDTLEEGEYLDAIAITKGKGWGGAIQRFGVAKQRRKATGKIRHAGTLGPWHPHYVMYTVPQAGQVGHHRRTQYNNRILIISDKPEEINPKGGFPHYGKVKTSYIIVRGSIPGSQKRFIFLRKGIRSKKKGAIRKPNILWIGK